MARCLFCMKTLKTGWEYDHGYCVLCAQKIITGNDIVTPQVGSDEIDYSVKKIKSYKGAGKGKAIVCGLGSSVKMLTKEMAGKYITIGVNDINMHFTPDYQLVSENIYSGKYTDNPVYEKKILSILKTKCQHVFSRYSLDFKHVTPTYLPLVDIQKEWSIDEIFNANMIPACRKITTAAIGLSIYMGFSLIGILGFDMTGRRAVCTKSNALNISAKTLPEINRSMDKVNEYAKERGVRIFNLSGNSLVTAFKMTTLKQFKRMKP